MYLRRKIDDYLLKWKNDEEHKPLIIKGARKVGKTESIKQFAKTYKNSVYINFAEETNFHTICDNGYSPKEIIKAITYIDNTKVFIPHETLIIFDEISDYPEILSSVKFFCVEKEYDAICSGLIWGDSYKRIQSNSVGYKTEYEMMSMDFEEFL